MLHLTFTKMDFSSVFLFVTIFTNWMILSEAVCERKPHETGVHSADVSAIVNKHNQLRLMIAQNQLPNQPRGINLKRMKWDNALAAEAQKIANTCEFKHVPVHDGRFSVGQNLAISSSTELTKGADWNGIVQSWFDEHASYHYPDNPNDKTGHYTQVVWADSVYVGCAFTSFDSSGKFPYSKLYVCNYGPAGNIIGQAPYKSGDGGCENLCD